MEYAKRELRPHNNLGLPKYAENLELWLAPGDSEMDCVQSKVSLEKGVVGSLSDAVDDFSVSDVGYNPEIYIGDEREQGGLRIMLGENGDPIKPVLEINQSAWKRLLFAHHIMVEFLGRRCPSYSCYRQILRFEGGTS